MKLLIKLIRLHQTADETADEIADETADEGHDLANHVPLHPGLFTACSPGAVH
jgi:hypothetical protein